MATVIRGDLSQLLVLGEPMSGDERSCTPPRAKRPLATASSPSAPCWASTRAQLGTASPSSLPHTAFLQQIHRGPLRVLCSPSLVLGRAGTGGTALFSARSSSVDPCSNALYSSSQPLPGCN